MNIICENCGKEYDSVYDNILIVDELNSANIKLYKTRTHLCIDCLRKALKDKMYISVFNYLLDESHNIIITKICDNYSQMKIIVNKYFKGKNVQIGMDENGSLVMFRTDIKDFSWQVIAFTHFDHVLKEYPDWRDLGKKIYGDDVFDNHIYNDINFDMDYNFIKSKVKQEDIEKTIKEQLSVFKVLCKHEKMNMC